MTSKPMVLRRSFWLSIFLVWFFAFHLIANISLLTQVSRNLQIASTRLASSFLQSDSVRNSIVHVDNSPRKIQSTTSKVQSKLDNGRSSNKSQYAIFYNVYINPKDISNGVRIIEEQTEQTFSLLSQQQRDNRIPLYYNMIGYNYSNRFCPINMSCTFLNFYPEAFEEVTLQSLYDYCVDHPHDRVYYLHNKGSYTPLKYNEDGRRLVTNFTIAHGDRLLRNKTLQCNVASLAWQAWPHWLAAVNFWLAKCSYVRTLIPPKDFNQARTEMFRRLLQPSTPEEATSLACLRSFFQNVTEIDQLSEEDSHLVGMGRYNFELWIYSHPHMVPCDRSNTVLTKKSLDEAWSSWPYAYHEWFRMHGRLYEFYQLYHKLPRRSSFFWKFFQDAEDPIDPPECRSNVDRSRYYRRAIAPTSSLSVDI